jgi:hypothetical protein
MVPEFPLLQNFVVGLLEKQITKEPLGNISDGY